MSDDLLQQIQTLQFSDKGQAEGLLLTFLRDIFSAEVDTVELRPLAVSLNSFNGFLRLKNGKRLFFKTHTEPDGVIAEYYNAKALAEAGYPVIQPIFNSTGAGKQLLVYEVIESPSVFDVAWAIENTESDAYDALTQAQKAADEQLFRLYQRTLEGQSAEEAAKSPVHQLFYHRLTGGRLAHFYGGTSEKESSDPPITLPGFHTLMSQVRLVKWEINGQRYDESLNDLIERAIQILQPAQEGPSVIGHGDAHNGNVFFQQDHQPPTLLYFDPAFAGRHHPLLDLTKPLFHNVFAMWMYFPQEKKANLHIQLRRNDGRWVVEHDYKLPPIREMFLTSKVDRVLIPTLRDLKGKGWLRTDWRPYLKASLFCCPFLTMNLTDAAKFPPEISLLGLTMAVEMGGESRDKRSVIDGVLDRVEAQLS